MLIGAYFVKLDSFNFSTNRIFSRKRSIAHIVINTFTPSTVTNFLKLLNTPKISRCFFNTRFLDQFLVSGKGLKNYMFLYNSETCMLVVVMVVKENNFYMHLAGKLPHLLCRGQGFSCNLYSI